GYPVAPNCDPVRWLRRIACVDLARGVIDFGEVRWHTALPDRPKPLDLLGLELGVERDDGRRGPPLRAAGLRCPAPCKEDLLLGRGEAEQADDGALQLRCACHAAFSWSSQLAASDSPAGLRTMKFNRSLIITVSGPNPMVCNRVTTVPGST